MGRSLGRPFRLRRVGAGGRARSSKGRIDIIRCGRRRAAGAGLTARVHRTSTLAANRTALTISISGSPHAAAETPDVGEQFREEGENGTRRLGAAGKLPVAKFARCSGSSVRRTSNSLDVHCPSWAKEEIGYWRVDLPMFLAVLQGTRQGKRPLTRELHASEGL